MEIELNDRLLAAAVGDLLRTGCQGGQRVASPLVVVQSA